MHIVSLATEAENGTREVPSQVGGWRVAEVDAPLYFLLFSAFPVA